MRRLVVRTLDTVVDRGKSSTQPLVRRAATGLDHARSLVGLDRIDLRTDIPAWAGAVPKQPMWPSDQDKLKKHRVDRGIDKAEASDKTAAAAKPAITVYLKRGCPYCRAALELLRERSIAAQEVDYTEDNDLRRAIQTQTGRKTTPHIFIHGKSIGGYDELRELDQSGVLAQMLAEPSELDDSEEELSVASLQARLDDGAAVWLLDVREPREWAATGVLNHAVQIPLGELEQRHAQLRRDGVWITYCHSGKRSLTARETLQRLGFNQVVSLRGGIVAWQAAKGTTVRPEAAAPHGLATEAAAAKRVKLPVLHPERSPFETLALDDAAVAAEPLSGSALVARVREVLEELRPMVQSDGGDIELLDIIDDVVGVQLTGNCIGCPSSQATLRQGIERKLMQQIPQIKGISSPQLAP